MNEHVVYANGGQVSVKPESVVSADLTAEQQASALATWRQPIIGEDGYQVARRRPNTVTPPAGTVVTFETGLVLPTGFTYAIEAVLLGILGAAGGDSASGVGTITQTVAGSPFWYAYPKAPANRLTHRLRVTPVIYFWAFSDSTAGERDITLDLNQGYQVAYVRALYRARVA